MTFSSFILQPSSFLSGISITCFAASYAVAWLLEFSRLFFQSGARRAVMIGFGGAGLFAHTLFLIHRGYVTFVSPLSSWHDWCLVGAWSLAALYLYLALLRPKNPVGLFVLPCVLALVGFAALASQEPFPEAEAARIWGLAHGVFLMLGSVAVLVGFALGVMYLVSAWRLKHKRLPVQGLRLPSLEWLQRMNERMIVASVFLLGLGFLAGIVSNLVNHAVPWSDPVVWSSSVMVLWMAAAAGFQAVYRPARVGRKVAYLTVLSFVFLLLTMGILLWSSTAHGVSRNSASRTTEGRR